MAGVGDLIREARERRGWSQSQLATLLNEASGHATLDGQYVSRWERGVRTPDEFWLGHLVGVLGLAPAQLDRARQQLPAERPQPIDLPALDALRRAVLAPLNRPGAEPDGPGPSVRDQLASEVTHAHRTYQLADYDAATRVLTPLLHRIDAVAAPAPVRAAAYLAGAKLASKLGDAALGWVVADRCVRAATESERSSLIGIAHYQLACALLGAGHLADAEATAATAVERLASAPPAERPDDPLSVHGALVLLLAVMAARRGDATTAETNLHAAGQLAEQLGRDSNRLWTAFGPTNVAIHELSVRVALGDATRGQQLGAALNTDAMPPVLRGRRSHVHLELGWAAVGHGEDALAVLHLLEAERVATQAVSRNAFAKDLVGTLLGRERQHATPGLRALAARAGVLAA